MEIVVVSAGWKGQRQIKCASHVRQAVNRKELLEARRTSINCILAGSYLLGCCKGLWLLFRRD